MTIQWLDRAILDKKIASFIQPADVVLDIGCGIRPQTLITPKLHICCEPHFEYVDFLRRKYKNCPNYLIVKAPASDLLPLLPSGSVDSVFLLDVIEHLPKDVGQTVVRECLRVARLQVVLFTPLGFLFQQYNEREVDAWGFHGGTWQQHRSGWTPDDFDPSWGILASRHYHDTNGKGEPFTPPAGAFWAIKNISFPAHADTDPFEAGSEPTSRGQSLSDLLAVPLCLLSLKEDQLASQAGQLAQQNDLLQQQSAAISQLARAIELMQSSLSWRCTRALNRLFRELLPKPIHGRVKAVLRQAIAK